MLIVNELAGAPYLDWLECINMHMFNYQIWCLRSIVNPEESFWEGPF